jgi:hypothetical protein
MDPKLPAMLSIFVATLAMGVAGLVILPSWSLVFGSLVGLSGVGAGIAGYAIRQA